MKSKFKIGDHAIVKNKSVCGNAIRGDEIILLKKFFTTRPTYSNERYWIVRTGETCGCFSEEDLRFIKQPKEPKKEGKYMIARNDYLIVDSLEEAKKRFEEGEFTPERSRIFKIEETYKANTKLTFVKEKI